ncbi:hypothetical protein GH721_07770 [Kriegella sp. EG-1]|nr:hypothetical protein [Flavobacteriaceae bacterium EG-1]
MKSFYAIILITFFGFQTYGLAQNQSHKNTSEIPIIDRMLISDSLDITFHSAGCFNNTTKTISIIKNDSNFIAVFNNTEIILNPSKVEALRNFENQLKTTQPTGCSTIDTYILKYRNEKNVYKDDTCSNFYGKLLLQNLEIEFN